MTRRILYVHYSNPGPYSPLEHGSQMLADEGWEVTFLCTATLGHLDLRLAPHPRIRVQQMSFHAPGWGQKLHYMAFMLQALLLGLRWRPQWVYASDPLACLPALIVSFLPGIRVVYHEHDSPSDDVPASIVKRVARWARARLAQRARMNILPNEQRAARFRSGVGHGQVVQTVLNCPRCTEVAEIRGPRQDQGLELVYQGSIVPSRLPIAVLQALRLVPSGVRLRINGYETAGHPGYVATLLKTARRLGLDERVQFVGTVPYRADMLARCRACDVGLSLMPKETNDPNVQEMVGASMKTFDYMVCGLPLLVTDLPSWRRFCVEPGYARACDPDDPQSIADALHWFLMHPEHVRAMAALGRQRILDQWNYEMQFKPVLEVLNS